MLAGATAQVLEFQGIQGLPYKIPNEIPNAPSRPLLNRKQASTLYHDCTLNASSNNKYLVLIYWGSKTLQSAV